MGGQSSKLDQTKKEYAEALADHQEEQKLRKQHEAMQAAREEKEQARRQARESKTVERVVLPDTAFERMGLQARLEEQTDRYRLACVTYNAQRLATDFPPKIGNANKLLVHRIACPDGPESYAGAPDVRFTRWSVMDPFKAVPKQALSAGTRTLMREDVVCVWPRCRALHLG